MNASSRLQSRSAANNLGRKDQSHLAVGGARAGRPGTEKRMYLVLALGTSSCKAGHQLSAHPVNQAHLCHFLCCESVTAHSLAPGHPPRAPCKAWPLKPCAGTDRVRMPMPGHSIFYVSSFSASFSPAHRQSLHAVRCAVPAHSLSCLILSMIVSIHKLLTKLSEI